ncbi:Ig-like domain-containing protein (plasmid) [Paracoccus sp. TK19116]|uniref:Ig-like domain-containing protein n=1 Tax=Paracoccus albicereus TaxID=2922394 RepID=A0ABT1MM80_9RHOB|nr:SdrD B-like domain-containing protein [Paracoccus albicereus]MCQ0969377.1 Ig-like domain-containing protein [Paracoccus albicereus]
MSYYYKKYEWTAFKESDLLKSGDSNFSYGDSFTMKTPSVSMSTYDNDSTLSGGTSTWWSNTYSADQYGQDASVNDCRVGCKMYAERYHVLQGSDGKTYYLIEIAIEGHDAPGAGSNYLTFYGAQPPAGTVLTSRGTCEVSGSWIDYSCLGAGDKVPPNTPPHFTNVPSDGMFCVDENTKLVIDLDAKDADCDALSYSITGGADSAVFQIDEKTGELSFKTAPDYEAPKDADGNNVYKVIVAVSDGKGGVTNKELSICVKDVDEKPTCVVIEAEDMQLCGYSVKCASSASGGEYVALNASWWGSSSGYIQTKFGGVSGEYDMTLRYWDGSGDGLIKIFVNGEEVGSVRLNDDCGWKTLSLEGLDIDKGDVITLKGYGSCAEGAIIDKIKLCPAEPEPQPGALEGRVFIDANKDGIDNGETGVQGVTVQLLTAAGVVVGTTLTKADGSYAFTGLDAGSYKVVFPTTVNGRVLTNQNVGNDDTIDSDANVTTGQTGNYTVVAGQTTKDVDAGLVDPGIAKLGDFVFIDANKNGVQDAGEVGLAGVGVTLYAADGVTVLATTTTDANGKYMFHNLDAGSYVVGFMEADGFDFTTANVGNDAFDSDANATTGKTGIVTLAIGETNKTVDAGVVAENKAPDAKDDAAKTCADTAKTVDVLANDTDADGDTLTITSVAGQSIVEGGTVDVNGVSISLVGGKLVIDGASAYADLEIGQKVSASYSYTISDGNGGIDTAKLDMSFCGAKNTLDTIAASLPESGLLTVSRDRVGDTFYNAVVTGTGDDRFDGQSFDIAYCVAGYDFLQIDTPFLAKIYLADADSIPAGTVANPQNLDMVNWILNQDFSAMDNGDGTGGTYTEAEIQGAIWGLTDDLVFVNENFPAYGTTANAREIYDMALANGDGFEAGEGDIVGVIFDPVLPDALPTEQPIILGIDWHALAQDCLCA